MAAPPFVIERGRCNCAVLRKASRRLSLLYDSALAASGLKSTQFAMLAEIDRRASAPPTVGDLAGALAMDQSTIGQNLRPLARDGLVTLLADAADRRRRLVRLTAKGRSRLLAALPLWAAAQTRFETEFGAQRASALRAELQSIIGHQGFGPDHIVSSDGS